MKESLTSRLFKSRFDRRLLSLVFIQVCLLSYSAVCHSPVPDEVGHLPAGLSHWELNDFSLYRVNPPLARLVVTAPVFFLDFDQESFRDNLVLSGDQGRTEGKTGLNLFASLGSRFSRWIVLARLANILFALIGLVVCYIWASELYGSQAGLLAATIWVISPYVLAFGAIITPDVPSASMGVLALYSFQRWLTRATLSSAVGCGLTLGLCLLTKSTWVILLPIFFGFAIVHLWQHKEIINRLFFQGFVVFSLALLTFDAGYGFDRCFEQLGDFAFQSKRFTRTETHEPNCLPVRTNWFSKTWMKSIPVPLPAQFLLGLDQQLNFSEPGNYYAYLRGELNRNGWWYYYLYVLLVKSTCGMIVLTVSVTAYRLWRRQWPRFGEWILIVPIAATLILLASHSGLNKHARYLLPIVPLIIVWVSQAAALAVTSLRRVALAICVIATASSSLSAFPHSMSYFNEFVGGPLHGRFHLLNSNIDYGQDLFYLDRYVQSRGLPEIGLATVTLYSPRLLGIEFFVPPTISELTKPENRKKCLRPGVYAISACHLSGYPSASPTPSYGLTGGEVNAFRYFEQFEPTGRIGYSMLIYDLLQKDVEKINERCK